MTLLLIDNNDSFTFNIVALLRQFSELQLTVMNAAQLTLTHALTFDKIIFSPGPGLPNEFPIMQTILAHCSTMNHQEKCPSILGICLGHQAIGAFFGASLKNLTRVCHGQNRTITCDNQSTLFRNLPEQFEVGLYHSWVVEEPLPDTLIATAHTVEPYTQEPLIMALSHKIYDIHGVQFHPESFISQYGSEIIYNFLYSPNSHSS